MAFFYSLLNGWTSQQSALSAEMDFRKIVDSKLVLGKTAFDQSIVYDYLTSFHIRHQRIS